MPVPPSPSCALPAPQNAPPSAHASRKARGAAAGGGEAEGAAEEEEDGEEADRRRAEEERQKLWLAQAPWVMGLPSSRWVLWSAWHAAAPLLRRTRACLVAGSISGAATLLRVATASARAAPRGANVTRGCASWTACHLPRSQALLPPTALAGPDPSYWAHQMSHRHWSAET